MLGVICKVSNWKTLSGETFCVLEKRLLSIFKGTVSRYCGVVSCFRSRLFLNQSEAN